MTTLTNSAQNPQKGVAARIFAPGVERIVWSFYRINGKTTGSATRVKLETLVAKLTGDNQAGVAILVSAETSKTNPAHGTLEQFVRDMGGAESIADTALKSAKGI